MRVATDYLWLPAVVLGFVLGVALVAIGQTPVAAPYTFTPDGRIEPTADQKPGTIAALMHEEGGGIRGWTDATTAGFNVPDLAGRHLVYRDGDVGAPVYVVAIEEPGSHLSAPAPFEGTFPLDGMSVWHQDIGGASDLAQDAGAPVGIEALEGLRLQNPRDAPTPNESYLAKQMQLGIARCLAPMVWELSFGAPDGTGDVVHTPHDWRTNNQIFRWRGTVSGQPYTGAYVEFSKYRYDPQHSSLNYGPKRVAQDVTEESDGKTKLILNDSDAPVDVTYSESESLTNSFSSSVTHGLTLDLSVDSTQTISGGYGGVSAEVSMQEHFGVSKTSEETHEQSEEGTHEESLEIAFTANPGEYYLVTLSKEHAVTYQDFRIDGVADFDIEIGWGHENAGRQRSRRPRDTVHLQGVAGLEQFVRGYDTNYPEMQGFWDRAYTRTKNGINCVTDPDHRRVTVSGTNQAALESNADYKVESLGHSVPDHLRHLPVEHASDVGR